MILSAWVRPVATRTDFCRVLLDDVRPWRHDVAPQAATWSLDLANDRLLLQTSGRGPVGWSSSPVVTLSSIGDSRTPLDPLLHTLAADLTLTVVSSDDVMWREALDLVRLWPHRRRWRGRGAGRGDCQPRSAVYPPDSPVEAAVEAAWTVVQIATSALPPGLGPDAAAAWRSLDQHLRRTLATFEPELTLAGSSGPISSDR